MIAINKYMIWRMLWLAFAVIVFLLPFLLLASGCAHIDKAKEIVDIIKDKPEAVEPAKPELPTNPQTPPDLEGSISEQWSFSRKDYDNTWRVRWPTYFYTAHKVGQGSYCTVNGDRAEFRSYDKDHGAYRPSYTMPQSIPVALPATCILYDREGNALAWFITDSHNKRGRLP